jgi:hypothetical protein
MAAALGKILVLELNGAGAGALEQAHGTLHVERVAVAGIGVDDQVGRHAVADQRHGVGHLAHADEADVGPPEPAVGDRGARNVKGVEAGLLGDQRGKRVMDAGRDHDRRLRQAGPQRAPGAHALPPPASVANHASPQALASSRTRRM